MELSHRQAFELLQRSIDGQLDAEQRTELERHLTNCAQCQATAALYSRLEQEVQAYRPAAKPSQKEIQQTILATQKHHRRWRMFKRLSSPVRTAAWVTAAAALILGVIWIFSAVPRQSQTGTHDVTRIVETIVVKETVVVTPVFDAEAEKEAVIAVSKKLLEDIAKADKQAVLAAVHKDWTAFTFAPPASWGSWTYPDLGPDWLNEPEFGYWDDYEVFVSPELAVIKGDQTQRGPDWGPVNAFSTEVYKKENGQWKLIHHHLTYGSP